MIKVLHFDKQIIVCEKPAGILSQADSSGARNLPEVLKKETNSYYVEAVHRLDKPVGGVMVYARSKPAAGILSAAVKEHRMQKTYLAVVHGRPEHDSGTYKDFLYRDAKHCKSYVVKSERKGAKEAILHYEVLDSAKSGSETLSLVKIELETGRTHQIRVQFSSRQMPLVGDERYGGAADKCPIALFSHRIAFSHPKTRENMEFSLCPPKVFPWNNFKI
ncbi:MAG: RluA family pseudouridine synthase [Clostridia bacterium]|nr:RluA family pseudouridine synthase [Clostridia bacterium]